MKLILFLSAEGVQRSALSDVQLHVLQSCLARDDYDKARKMLKDWSGIAGQKVYITKWVPGEHYYVKDRKFNSYKEASEYARSIGLIPQPGVRYYYGYR